MTALNGMLAFDQTGITFAHLGKWICLNRQVELPKQANQYHIINHIINTDIIITLKIIYFFYKEL